MRGGVRVPRALVEAFIAEAKAQSHREIAAAIVLDDGGEFELRWPEIETSSAGHVRYIDSDIDDDRLVIDLHSHAGARAFFSQQDDRSDGSRRGPYLAMVIGRCADDVPEVATRLVLPPASDPTLPGCPQGLRGVRMTAQSFLLPPQWAERSVRIALIGAGGTGSTGYM
jgi:PRTRC genetic system protein A